MVDSIRCPACRGSKKVPKLGGVIGECNTCNGKGQIKAIDKPKPVEVIVEDVSKELINAVADCVPATSIEVLKTVTPDVKIDGKKAIYKRKRA